MHPASPPPGPARRALERSPPARPDGSLAGGESGVRRSFAPSARRVSRPRPDPRRTAAPPSGRGARTRRCPRPSACVAESGAARAPRPPAPGAATTSSLRPPCCETRASPRRRSPGGPAGPSPPRTSAQSPWPPWWARRLHRTRCARRAPAARRPGRAGWWAPRWRARRGAGAWRRCARSRTRARASPGRREGRRQSFARDA